MPIILLIHMVQALEDPFVGKKATSFCLPDLTGSSICLDSFRQTLVVLYFYPRDNTPGCTIEAMEFNAVLEKFADFGAQVIGVSAYSFESHQKFAEIHNLSILLVSDTEHTVLKAYDVWKPKTIFGKEFLGTQRNTFLIDPQGTIVAVWRKVNPNGHAEEVKATILEKMK